MAGSGVTASDSFIDDQILRAAEPRLDRACHVALPVDETGPGDSPCTGHRVGKCFSGDLGGCHRTVFCQFDRDPVSGGQAVGEADGPGRDPRNSLNGDQGFKGPVSVFDREAFVHGEIGKGEGDEGADEKECRKDKDENKKSREKEILFPAR